MARHPRDIIDRARTWATETAADNGIDAEVQVLAGSSHIRAADDHDAWGLSVQSLNMRFTAVDTASAERLPTLIPLLARELAGNASLGRSESELTIELADLRAPELGAAPYLELDRARNARLRVTTPLHEEPRARDRRPITRRSGQLTAAALVG